MQLCHRSLSHKPYRPLKSQCEVSEVLKPGMELVMSGSRHNLARAGLVYVWQELPAALQGTTCLPAPLHFYTSILSPGLEADQRLHTRQKAA